MRETRFIIAEDGVEIAADWYPAAKPNPAVGVLLLHMMPETRKSYRTFAELLQRKGSSAVAIDFRGHGESLRAGDNSRLDYRSFSDSEHSASIRDGRAGVLFLRSKGVSEVYLVGASIGANIALQLLAEDRTLRGAVLLSPGYNYRGIETKPMIPKLHPEQRVFLVGSRDDTRGSGDTAAEMAEGLYNMVPEKIEKKIRIFEQAGHGTEILQREPEFKIVVIEWMLGAK